MRGRLPRSRRRAILLDLVRNLRIVLPVTLVPPDPVDRVA
jgi:hypothetical protein